MAMSSEELEKVGISPDFRFGDGPIIETPRLVLRKLLSSDAESLFRMDSDPRTHIFMGGTKPAETVAESEHYISVITEQYEKFHTGRLAVIEKVSGCFVGWCGIKFDTVGENNRSHYYEVGYRFLPEFWGRGYGTESAAAVLKFGFEQLRCPVIVGVAELRHSASCRILEKIGLRQTETYMYAGVDNGWFELSREEYLHAAAACGDAKIRMCAEK
jgi:[ribosomal protein S5]-alanine N-acetyltransferase